MHEQTNIGETDKDFKQLNKSALKEKATTASVTDYISLIIVFRNNISTELNLTLGSETQPTTLL